MRDGATEPSAEVQLLTIDTLHAANSHWQQLCPKARYGPSYHTNLSAKSMGFTVHECDLGGPFFDAENTQPGTQEMQIKVVLRQHSTAYVGLKVT
jgi:hypothetical protein